jgi:hypothetical protein
MSLRSQTKREGDYPSTLTGIRQQLKIDKHTIILTTYETNSTIHIYLGGVKRWCVHSTIHRDDNNKIKEEGFLVKIRYDLLCSVEEKIQTGGDIKKLLQLLIQYIHDTYPEVKYLSFSDLSTRRCDSGTHVNLAVMTYLYSGKTWYEKNFDATISQKSKNALDDIIKKLNKSKIETPWHIIKDMMYNYKTLPFTEKELEVLYKETLTWKDFFEPIFQKIDIAKLCIFVSDWLDSFIIQYFNNLMGLSYDMPIKPTNIVYTKSEFVGGRYKSYFKGARKNKTIKRFSEME